MQINNNTCFTNFRMAMRISPEAKPALEKATKEELAMIARIGEELKDTKCWDLLLGRDLVPTVTCYNANKYMYWFSAKQDICYPNFIRLSTMSCSTDYGKPIIDAPFKMSSAEEAKEVVDSISNAHTTIEKAAETVKALEKREARIEKEIKALKAENAEKDIMIKDLMSKYKAE